MVNSIINDSTSKNILIVGAPRSGTHALASLIKRHDQSFQYLGEIGMIQKSTRPWDDIEPLLKISDKKYLAHIVQLRGKLGMLPKIDDLKSSTYIINIRRRDKVKQFASWIYFRSIGAIYNFDHCGQDFVKPGSYHVTYEDIEQFIVEQIVDDQFCADKTLYYEDVDFSGSIIHKNAYAFPPELMIKNLDEVKSYLSQWTYPIK